MKPSVFLACSLVLFSASSGYACDLIKDPRASWEEMVGQADIVFVGKVVEIVPRSAPDEGDRAVFQVERPIKGEIGRTFEAAQGMNSCTEEFEIGDWVIFAGTSIGADGGTQIPYAESTGWDPTVFLTDPPTAEQMVRLEYLKQITEDRYEASK